MGRIQCPPDIQRWAEVMVKAQDRTAEGATLQLKVSLGGPLLLIGKMAPGKAILDRMSPRTVKIARFFSEGLGNLYPIRQNYIIHSWKRTRSVT